MSTLATRPSTTAAPRTHPRTGAGTRPHRTFAGVLAGEWIKLVSLRSTWWVLAATVAVTALVSFAAAMSLNVMADDPMMAPALETMQGAQVVASGYQIGAVAIAVLGALVVTGEYSTGMVRSSFAAVPTRTPVLAAKAIALTLVTTAVATASLAVSYLVTLPQMSRYDLVPPLDELATWQMFGGAAYFLVVAAVFSLAVGVLLRSTAGAVTVALSVLLLLPSILAFIRVEWVETLVSYLPLPASTAFLGDGEASAFGGEALSATTGFLVVTAYAVVPLVAAAVVLRRRDV